MLKKFISCYLQLNLLFLLNQPMHAGQETVPLPPDKAGQESEYPAKSVEGERIFRLYKASIFHSSKMQEHFNSLTKHVSVR